MLVSLEYLVVGIAKQLKVVVHEPLMYHMNQDVRFILHPSQVFQDCPQPIRLLGPVSQYEVRISLFGMVREIRHQQVKILVKRRLWRGIVR